MHRLTDEQLAALVTWAKNTPELQAVFLRASRAKGTAEWVGGVDLALSIIGHDPFWRLATFLSYRRVWKTELEEALGLCVQLERARGEPTPEEGYVELWRRA